MEGKEYYMVCELLGSFLSNKFYNLFYQSAKKAVINGQETDVVKAYEQQVSSFLKYFQTDFLQRNLLKDIVSYVRDVGGIKATDEQVQYYVLRHFIRESFISAMGSSTKSQYVIAIMRIASECLVTYLRGNFYGVMFDPEERVDPNNTRRLQDEMHNIFGFVKTKFDHAFRDKPIQAEPQSDARVARLTERIRELLVHKNQEIESLRREVEQQVEQIKKLQKDVNSRDEVIRRLQVEEEGGREYEAESRGRIAEQVDEEGASLIELLKS